MKKLLKVLSVTLALILVLGSCSGGGSSEESAEDTSTETTETTDGQKLVVGATAIPHAEILEEIQDDLKEQGIDLEIKVFNDYNTPNIALADGEIDANFFQHEPYLDDFKKNHNLDIVSVGQVHVEPMGLYSKEIKDLQDIPNGAKISIPNDPTNGGRALILLDSEGIIKLKEGTGLEATIDDIEENPKEIEFSPMEAAMLPKTLEDVDASVINSNYALEGGLDLKEDVLVVEGIDSPYANVIATRTENKDDEAIQKLMEALTSDKVKTFIEEKYEGAIVPAF